MNNTEKVTEQGGGGDDGSHFDRLPDEVVLVIFNKLLDLKTLCRTSLVSTRFAAAIPQVLSVSFAVPRRKPNSSEEDDHASNSSDSSDNLSKKLIRFLLKDIVSKPFRFIRQIVAPRPVPSSISAFYGDSFRSAVCFLSKFRDIRSLQIELPSSGHGGEDSLLKWRVRFGTKLESFLFLYPTSLEEFNGVGGGHSEDDDDEESELTSDLLKFRVHLAFQCLKDAVVRHRMLLFLIEQHAMLEHVEITDSKKQGRLFARNEQVAELRAWMGSSLGTLGVQLKSIEVPVSARQWYVPVLELPMSKCVMKGATLVVMGLVANQGESGSGSGGGGGGGGDDDVMVNGAFEEKEEAFGEAVTEMMVNHKSKMKILL
ncbi:F-box protein At1g30200-like [Cornus florida]|uniref:F-box protein At1g30200-like n=1 Tax=Cornus florida TaxID=4283 RepID=UPI0028A20802|nr:F-box protein At1g30200-like [Cornus florida]